MKTKTKVSPYIKVRRNLFNSNEMAELMTREGATGAGTYIIICCYLAMCDDGIGSMKYIKEIADKCHKSKQYIKSIIKDYGLFDVCGELFTSKMIQKLINVEFTLSPEGREKQAETPSENQPSPVRSLSMNEPPINHERKGGTSYMCAGAEARKNEECRMKNENKTSSAEEGKKAAAEADFLSSINKAFGDEEWLKLVEESLGIHVFSDETVRRISRSQFTTHVLLHPNDNRGLPMDEQWAKNYFANYLNPQHNTRRELDRILTEKLRERNRALAGRMSQEIPKLADDEIHRPSELETVDWENKRRWGPHGEPVDWLGMPCAGRRMWYNIGEHEWQYIPLRNFTPDREFLKFRNAQNAAAV